MSEPILIVSGAARFGDDVDPQEIANEEVKLFLEECEEEDADDSYEEQLESLVQSCIQDFPDEDDSPAARYAAQMARACITQGTEMGTCGTYQRPGGIVVYRRVSCFVFRRVIKAFITYHRKRCPTWDSTAVTKQTPFDICLFITQKCGNKKDGFEGRKFATAVSTRAALTMWYRTLPSRRNESTVEWRYDEKTGVCSGLPMRSRAVAEYMVGLEKTKARAGEATQSMRALSLDNIHRLHDHCFRDNQTDAERRWGVMYFAVYLFAFLMVLWMDEALKMMFEGVDNIPGDS
ncbi:hypothetical protein EUX98_g9480 [Antrodiella citrinella]|uniref:Uncharacterized protein n=1 Tax=Antrodiella citrinella TaxID=2447956 RepID=A0A4S4LY80_9APHY|nr:hypothetical protein EUX98_g9480 [Antrodiella citrinella]